MIESLATEQTIETTLRAYIECALWSSTDNSREDGGDPLDDNYGPDDLAPEAFESMREDVTDFLASCWNDDVDLSPIEPGQIGHDFWLTRNHHGAGFWDRGLGELGEELTRRAQAYGSSDLYIGDDGTLYV
jgi:hypothetical protein